MLLLHPRHLLLHFVFFLRALNFHSLLQLRSNVVSANLEIIEPLNRARKARHVSHGWMPLFIMPIKERPSCETNLKREAGRMGTTESSAVVGFVLFSLKRGVESISAMNTVGKSADESRTSIGVSERLQSTSLYSRTDQESITAQKRFSSNSIIVKDGAEVGWISITTVQ